MAYTTQQAKAALFRYLKISDSQVKFIDNILYHIFSKMYVTKSQNMKIFIFSTL